MQEDIRALWLVPSSSDQVFLGLSPSGKHCVVFLGKTLDCHIYSASLHTGL